MTDAIPQLNASLAGRYVLEREIGAGGMAVVFLAEDLKHKRKVALKVLKPELGAVLGAERFLSEIQVTARLQHPNLLPLFDSGEAGGLLFYVMPFVEGEALRARLEREKQLPVDEAVRIAVAIAGALDYAHGHGVIHRDLKPENILLQHGQPVIADFGIALAVSNAGGARVTQTGLSLGTPQYMSPEQATGDRVIDGRTDVYSLGAMTYEMLTGEPPHTGTSAQAIIAKLMTEDVRPLPVLRRAVPAHVDGAVRHALEKLAADRFASALDFSLALTGARPFVMAAVSAPIAANGGISGLSRRMRALVASMASIAVVATTAAVWLATRPVVRPGAVRFTLGLPDSVTLYGGGGMKVALSADGSKIVFVGVKDGKRALYLRQLDDPVARPVPGGEAGTGNFNVSPYFSPNGDWIVYQVDAAIKRIPAAGGTAQTLVDSGGSSSWGDHEKFVYTSASTLWLGSPQGRDARPLVRPDSAHGVYGYSWPEVLPGGEYALVTLVRATQLGIPLDSMRLAVVSLATGAVKDLGVYGSNPRYESSGHVLFGRAGNQVFVAPFSLRTREITARATLLLQNVWQGTGGATGFTVSRNGILAYNEGTYVRPHEFLIVSRSGAVRRVPGDHLSFGNPRLSPDGKRVVTNVRFLDNRDGVVVVDLGTGARERLAAPDSGVNAEWTRDGSRVVFARRSHLATEYVSRTPDRSGADTVLRREKETLDVPSFVQGVVHGFAAVARRTQRPGTWGVYLAPMDSLNVTRPFATGSMQNYSPTISADGRLLAWVSDETGVPQVYAQPIPGPGGRVLVSLGGGVEPVWSREGATLYYRAPGAVMSADIGGSPLRASRRNSLFADPYSRFRGFGRDWDVFPGGKEFLMTRPFEADQASVAIVLNWRQVQATAGTPVVPQ